MWRTGSPGSPTDAVPGPGAFVEGNGPFALLHHLEALGLYIYRDVCTSRQVCGRIENSPACAGLDPGETVWVTSGEPEALWRGSFCPIFVSGRGLAAIIWERCPAGWEYAPVLTGYFGLRSRYWSIFAPLRANSVQDPNASVLIKPNRSSECVLEPSASRTQRAMLCFLYGGRAALLPWRERVWRAGKGPGSLRDSV